MPCGAPRAIGCAPVPHLRHTCRDRSSGCRARPMPERIADPIPPHVRAARSRVPSASVVSESRGCASKADRLRRSSGPISGFDPRARRAQGAAPLERSHPLAASSRADRLQAPSLACARSRAPAARLALLRPAPTAHRLRGNSGRARCDRRGARGPRQASRRDRDIRTAARRDRESESRASRPHREARSSSNPTTRRRRRSRIVGRRCS